jgi:hypothetical protein
MSIMQRLLGILLYRPAVYRYVALNENLTRESLFIVIFVSFMNTLVIIWQIGISRQTILGFLNPILFSWLLASWLIAWAVNRILKKRIPFIRILRGRGYAHIYALLFIALNFLSTATGIYTIVILIADILNIGADTLSIRESCEISTFQALIFAIINGFVLGGLILILQSAIL